MRRKPLGLPEQKQSHSTHPFINIFGKLRICSQSRSTKVFYVSRQFTCLHRQASGWHHLSRNFRPFYFNSGPNSLLLVPPVLRVQADNIIHGKFNTQQSNTRCTLCVLGAGPTPNAILHTRARLYCFSVSPGRT